MNLLFLSLFIILIKSQGDEKSFNAIYERLKEDNYRIDYNFDSGVIVLFYDQKDVNYTQAILGQTFIIPTDSMTKIKIINFKNLILSLF